ncbi:hypothetical protein IIB50_02335 [Patescibacteria group bacterium]|nr:hypothetical protein [Patescibacteria group bacterium]
MNNKRAQVANWIMKILASIGLIVVLAFVVWGGVQTIKSAPSMYSFLSSSLTASVIKITSVFIPSGTNTEDIEGEQIKEEDLSSYGNDALPNQTTITQGQESSNTYMFSGGNRVVSDPDGFVDLSVIILATGILDKTTNEFIATSSIKLSDKVAISFEVINKGTRTSSGWTFNAVLPTFPHHIFHSKSQHALGPGDKIEFTLGFDSIAGVGEQEIIINVDPAGNINESTKSNNIVRVTVTVDEIN